MHVEPARNLVGGRGRVVGGMCAESPRSARDGAAALAAHPGVAVPTFRQRSADQAAGSRMTGQRTSIKSAVRAAATPPVNRN